VGRGRGEMCLKSNDRFRLGKCTVLRRPFFFMNSMSCEWNRTFNGKTAHLVVVVLHEKRTFHNSKIVDKNFSSGRSAVRVNASTIVLKSQYRELYDKQRFVVLCVLFNYIVRLSRHDYLSFCFTLVCSD